jgi:hypothetical protein
MNTTTTKTPADVIVIERAMRNYRRKHSYRLGYPGPCKRRSRISGNTVTLKNRNGVLATYAWSGKRLMQIEDNVIVMPNRRWKLKNGNSSKRVAQKAGLSESTIRRDVKL